MIKDLTPEEVSELRKKVEDQFKKRPFTGAGIKANQYKLSYEEIRKDIIEVVPGSEPSVSLTRLRKLFFYTNPEFCPEDKLVKPSFGDDFIRVLLTYVEELPDPPGAPLQPMTSQLHFRWWKYVAGLLILAIVLIAYCYWSGAQPRYWTEDFDDTSVAGLKSRGWEILDYDSVAFSRQPVDGCLTLFTYPGGYWVKPGETPMEKNAIIKAIPTDNCIITTKLVNSFNPVQNWQGAGLILLNAQKDYENSFTLYYRFATEQMPNDSITNLQKFQAVLLKNGRPNEDSWGARYIEQQNGPFKEIELEIEIIQNHVYLSYRKEHDWYPAQLKRQEIELHFQPRYIGIGAGQGFTNDKRIPLNADTIPASFDYIKVEPAIKSVVGF